MSKIISSLLFAFLTALLVTFISAQEKKTSKAGTKSLTGITLDVERTRKQVDRNGRGFSRREVRLQSPEG